MKVLSEIIPLVIFFITYKLYDLITATIALIIATIFSAVLAYVLYKQKPSHMVIASTFIMAVLGGISTYTQNPNFIKMKPSILYTGCAIVLFVGIYFNKLFIKMALDKIFILDDKQWKSISWQWIALFCTFTLMNELTWRLIDEQSWVYFKVIVIPIILTIFLSIQIYIYRANIKKDHTEK